MTKPSRQTTTSTTYLFDGMKAVALNDLPDSAWNWYTPHLTEETEQVQEYFQAVPWLNRAVTLRAQSLASLPFSIMKGTTELDTSDDYQNKLGFLPNPTHLLWLVEAALTLLGRAYLFREHNRVRTLSLRYLLPTTITPQFSELEGLIGFTRQLGHGVQKYTPQDLIYFWQLDPFVEIGPGSSPAQAALKAAGVLFNVDRFATDFFKRGAIKATLLTLEGPPPPDAERSKLKEWWKRAFSGIENSWGTEVVNAAIKPVQVGEGVKELTDTVLTQEKREDISTALGIPQTLLFSQAANYATAQEDRLSYYRETVVPEAEFIAAVLNEQLLKPLGMQWQFRPETLDVFQADETERAQAFAQYVNAGMPLSVVAEMLGLELPTGIEYEDLDDMKRENAPPQLVPFMGPPGQQPQKPAFGNNGNKPEQQEVERAKADLRRWQRVARKCVAEGKPVRAFDSDAIPGDIMQQVRALLDGATTEEEVKAAFGSVKMQSARFIPKGADDPLLPVPETLELSAQDIDDALDYWDKLMPEYRGMLRTDGSDVEVFDGDHW